METKPQNVAATTKKKQSNQKEKDTSTKIKSNQINKKINEDGAKEERNSVADVDRPVSKSTAK